MAETSVSVKNFPPEGEDVLEVRVSVPHEAVPESVRIRPTTLALQSTPDEDTGETNITLMLASVCEGDQLVQALGEVIELLTAIRDSAERDADK